MKPRAEETAVVRSLHPALAPVGSTKNMTPKEADLMVLIGRAERIEEAPAPQEDVTAKEGTYTHRMMTAKQPPSSRKRGRK